MKWLIGCLLALVVVSSAFAGEDPYVAIVGPDISANTFYLSPKYIQFLYDESVIIPPDDTYFEEFTSQMPAIGPEICDELGRFIPPGTFIDRGNANAIVRAGNSGWFQWAIQLPKKPNAINLCFQCGVLKPNAFSFNGMNYTAVNNCAAYTGERAHDLCTRDEVNAGRNPVIPAALPQVTAIAEPGPFNDFEPFHLTAYRNPGTYGGANLGAQMGNNQALQVLNGDVAEANPLGDPNTNVPGTRIMLKTCFDKCINIKLPVSGQQNALGEFERDLEYGDVIFVRLSIPRQNSVDVYCHEQSLKILGVGEAWW